MFLHYISRETLLKNHTRFSQSWALRWLWVVIYLYIVLMWQCYLMMLRFSWSWNYIVGVGVVSMLTVTYWSLGILNVNLTLLRAFLTPFPIPTCTSRKNCLNCVDEFGESWVLFGLVDIVMTVLWHLCLLWIHPGSIL